MGLGDDQSGGFGRLKRVRVGGGQFYGERWRERFKDRKHRMKFHNRRLYRRKLKAGEPGYNYACKTLVGYPRRRRFSVALCWRKRGVFTFVPGGRPVVRVYPDGTVAEKKI